MSRHQACGLGAGASDIGILAQQLRRLRGDPGEFAITDLNGRGLSSSVALGRTRQV
jgi:hypothetical protein